MLLQARGPEGVVAWWLSSLDLERVRLPMIVGFLAQLNAGGIKLKFVETLKQTYHEVKTL